jgi:sarcosine/dimethylglycine N-methyltransferase
VTDVLDGLRDHYRATGLIERLETALTAFGPDEQRLTPQQLATLDHFHTRGLAGTVELAKLAGITADMLVLDVGSALAGRRAFWPRPTAAGLRASISASHLSMPRAI